MPIWLMPMTPVSSEAVVAQRREDAERQGDERGERHRHHGERQADAETAEDELRDRRVIGITYAEIAREEPEDPGEIARRGRLIEAELVGERGDRARGRHPGPGW